jgi:hypothetical protein
MIFPNISRSVTLVTEGSSSPICFKMYIKGRLSKIEYYYISCYGAKNIHILLVTNIYIYYATCICIIHYIYIERESNPQKKSNKKIERSNPPKIVIPASY